MLPHRWNADDVPDQTGRTALVTGANSGLGLHTAIGLAGQGARVLMATRSAERGEAALKRVRADVPGATVELVRLDLASLASVREAAEDVAGRTSVLDVLVCNAGVMALPRQLTADGFEMQLGTNHLGHFALTGLLLPQLLAAAAPLVVAVSSGAHRTGSIAFDDLQGERSYGRWKAYGQSKLANLLFVSELQRRAGVRLLAAAAHPGYAATNLQSGQGHRVLELAMSVGNRVVAQSDRAGARPSLYAATMPGVQGDDYWGPVFETRGWPKRSGRSRAARDTVAAGRLWDVSTDLTGVVYAF